MLLIIIFMLKYDDKIIWTVAVYFDPFDNSHFTNIKILFLKCAIFFYVT